MFISNRTFFALGWLLAACPGPGPNDGGGNGGGGGGSSGELAILDAIPANGATNVSVHTSFFLELSRPADRVDGVFGSEKPSLVGPAEAPFYAQGNFNQTLAYGTTYSGSLTLKDAQGAQSVVPWSFTTTSPPSADTVAPALASSAPSSMATGVALDAGIVLRFTEPVLSPFSSVSTDAPGALGKPQWSIDRKEVTLAGPPAGFPHGKQISISFAVRDGSHNAGGGSFRFTTAGAPTPPTVLAVSPAASSTGAPLNARISVSFSEVMDTTSVTSSFIVSPAVTCTYSHVLGQVFVCTPGAALAASTQYTVTIGAAARSSDGGTLAAPYNATFSTGTGSETSPPTLTAVSPPDMQPRAELVTDLVFDFSEPMDLAATTTAAVVRVDPGQLVLGSYRWSSDGRQLRIVLPSRGATQFYWNLTGATDVARNVLATRTGTFTAVNHAASWSTGITSSFTDAFVFRPPAQMIFAPYILLLGDDVGNRPNAVFLTFDLAPPGAVRKITAARLRLLPVGCQGRLEGLGRMVIDSLTSRAPPSDLLTAPDEAAERSYHAWTCDPALSTHALDYGLRLTDAIDVTEKVRADWANRGTRGGSTFRMRFEQATNGDGKADRVMYRFERSPTLEVDYEID